MKEFSKVTQLESDQAKILAGEKFELLTPVQSTASCGFFFFF
jgi:hypothetical protein